MKTKKKSGKTLRKSGKSQGKIREFDGIKKVGTLSLGKRLLVVFELASILIFNCSLKLGSVASARPTTEFLKTFHMDLDTNWTE